jgi:signal transduction histidine kinase
VKPTLEKSENIIGNNETRRILLIEDNPGDARLIKEMLNEEKSFPTLLDSFDRLSTGLEHLAKEKVDAVILDLGLPDSQGLGTFEKVYSVHKKVPILILTGNRDDSLALEAVRKGAQDYLIKGKIDGSLLNKALSYAIERKKTEEILRIFNEKLRVEGSLIRHDARNKIAVIEGNLHLTKKKLPKESPAFINIKNIESALNKIESIFDFAAAYERIGLENLVPLNVENVVAESVALFSDIPDVKIFNECHSLTVLADSLLTVLFHNLIDNSLKHGEKTRKIRIYYQEDEAGQLKIFYEDDGTGIPDAVRPKLFTEGCTTGQGTGYGLYLIRKVSEFYGWKIQETGKAGLGAQFTITISEKDGANGKRYWIKNRSKMKSPRDPIYAGT